MAALRGKISFSFTDTVGICISIVLLWLVFRNIHFDLFWDNYYQLNTGVFALCILLHIVETFLLGLRWQMLFGQEAAGKYDEAVASFWLGNFFNNLLPGRIGDLLKIRFLTVKYGISYKNGIAALIVEKLLDAQAVGFFALLSVSFFPLNIPSLIWITSGLVMFIFLADNMLVLLFYKKRMLKKMLAFLPSARARVWLYNLFLIFANKIIHLFRTQKIILFLTSSWILYVAGILSYYLLIKASGLENYFADFSICIIFPIFFLVIHFVPSAPSSLGVIHYGIYKALVLIAEAKGIEITPILENQIIFSAILFHLFFLIPETLIGFFYLLRERQVILRFNVQ